MELQLIVDGKEKIFTTPFVSARHFRKLMEFDEKIDYMDLRVDDIDELAGFVCDVFGNQFTVDEFIDGVASHELIPTITKVFSFVRTGKVPKEEELGNEQGK